MILYDFIQHKKINGTLFYCFEYFLFLNKYKDTEFWIYNISDNDMKFIMNVFKNKYVFDENILEKIKIPKLKDFLNTPETVIILDNKTYDRLRCFISKSKILWHKTDNKEDNFRTKKYKKSDITFGSYWYQNYDIFETLQFNFEIYPKILNTSNNIFISSPSLTNNQSLFLLESKNIFINKNKILFKEDNKHIKNLFEEFNTFIYVHNDKIDTNNRLIVEAYFYNKNIILVDSTKNDSTYFRLNDLNKFGIDYFNLSLDNKLIKEYLDT
jgi:hypothetical protein